MKKVLFALLVVVGLCAVSFADTTNPLSAQIFPNFYVNVPGSNMSVDTLLNINVTAANPNPQFLAGLTSRLMSYKGFGANMGAITNTGYSYRAYYSLSYDYVNNNANLLMLISQITVGVYFSTLFDGQPTLYGLSISKKLF